MRLSRTFAIFSGVAFGLFMTACSKNNTNGVAANPNPPGTYADRPAASNVSSSDRDFASKAAQGGMTEVEMGKLAQRLGGTSRVKSFGEMLVNDHTKLNDQLKDLAARENLSLPSDVDASQHSTIDKLAKLSGAHFDREFKKVTIDDHKDDIKEFEKEANDGSNQALKDFATSALPKLRDHLKGGEAISR